MARKIEKQRDRGMAHIVKILPWPRKQRQSYQLSFRFDSGREKVKNYRLYSFEYNLAPTDSHRRIRSSSIRIELASLNIEEKSFHRFEFKCPTRQGFTIWGEFRQNFTRLQRTSTSHVRFNTFCNRAWRSRRTCSFNRRKWRRESRPMSWRFRR